MLTRRTFLHSGLLAFYIPSGNRLSATLTDPLMMSARIFTATGCSDTRAFTAALPALSETMDLYQGENLYAIAAGLENRHCAALAGLTRHSEFILISQLASEHGYQLIYSGRHHYRESVLHHQLEGKGTVVGKLAESFASEKTSWPCTLAVHMPDIIRSGGSTLQEQVQLQAGRPAGSPGYLVSWAFRQD